ALDLARHGEPRQSFYLTGRVGEEGISLHGEGGKVVLTRTDGTREEVDLLATGRRVPPGGAVESIPPEPPAPSSVPVTSSAAAEPSSPVEPSVQAPPPPDET